MPRPNIILVTIMAPNNHENETFVLLYAKNPVAGNVKTRLGRPPDGVGYANAADVYRALLLDQIDRIHDCHDITLCISTRASDAAALQHVVGGHVEVVINLESSDLGVLMMNSFRVGLSDRAFRNVIIIGSDVPALSVTELRQAVIALNGSDVVLGPDAGGGLYLIGARVALDNLECVDWSRGTDFEEISRRVRAAGLRVETLHVLADIDTTADLMHYNHQRLNGGYGEQSAAPRTWSLLDRFTAEGLIPSSS